MNKNTLAEFKEKLEQQKLSLEKELENFATEDKNIKGNWDTKRIAAADTDMEEKADEMEEYDNLLSLEHNLELRLKDINIALEKIDKNQYGICERCDREIEEKRLMACPEARLCIKCNENKG